MPTVDSEDSEDSEDCDVAAPLCPSLTRSGAGMDRSASKSIIMHLSSPPNLADLRVRFARAMRVCDDAEAEQIAIILSGLEIEENDSSPRTIDVWGASE